MAIIEELLTAIERDGRTQYELARDSGVAASQISRLRHGLRTIHLDTAERLAQALGLELREIPRARKGR
ncbi:MAG: helix-turn-helix transcriptional regulator [Phycisphaerae bacterium]